MAQAVECGKISTGLKKVKTVDGRTKNAGAEKTGFIICTPEKTDFRRTTERSVIDRDLQMKLIRANFPGYAKKLEENFKSEPDKEKKQKMLDVFFEQFHKKCMKLPVKLLHLGNFKSGRKADYKDPSKKKSFCSLLEMTGQTVRDANRRDDDGGKTHQVLCDPGTCSYNKRGGSQDGVKQCSAFTVLNLHIDLPGAKSGLSYYTLYNNGFNTRDSLRSTFESLYKICGPFFYGLPVELYIVYKPQVTQDDKVEQVPIIQMRPRIELEELSKWASEKAQQHLLIQEAKERCQHFVDFSGLTQSEAEELGELDSSPDEDAPEEVVTMTPDEEADGAPPEDQDTESLFGELDMLEGK